MSDLPVKTTIQAIFFDIGDTLVFDDPPLPERLLSAARTADLPVNDALFPAAFRVGEAYAVRRYVDGVVWDAPGALRQTLAHVWEAMGFAPPDDAHWATFAAAFAATSFTRFVHPGALDLLRKLQSRGFRLGAISDWEDTLPDVLTDLGLLTYFDALAVSAVVGVTKPHPALFGDALSQLAIPPANCLHLGDWYELDVAGAETAGMSALLFDWPGRRPDAHCPRVTTFEELSAYLLALPSPTSLD